MKLEELCETRVALSTLADDVDGRRQLEQLTHLTLVGSGQVKKEPVGDSLAPLWGKLKSLTHLILREINMGMESSLIPLLTWLDTATNLTHIELIKCELSNAPDVLRTMMSSETVRTKLSVLEEANQWTDPLLSVTGEPDDQRPMEKLKRLTLCGIDGPCHILYVSHPSVGDGLTPLYDKIPFLTHLRLQNVCLGTAQSVRSLLNFLNKADNLTDLILKGCRVYRDPVVLCDLMSSKAVLCHLSEFGDWCDTMQQLEAYSGQPGDTRPFQKLTHFELIGGGQWAGAVQHIPIEGRLAGLYKRLQILTHLSLDSISLASHDSITYLVTWISTAPNLTHVSIKDCELQKIPKELCDLMSSELAMPKLSQIEERFYSHKALFAICGEAGDRRPLQNLTSLKLTGGCEVWTSPIKDDLTLLYCRLTSLTHLSLHGINLGCVTTASALVTWMSTAEKLEDVQMDSCRIGPVLLEGACLVDRFKERAESSLGRLRHFFIKYDEYVSVSNEDWEGWKRKVKPWVVCLEVEMRWDRRD